MWVFLKKARKEANKAQVDLRRLKSEHDKWVAEYEKAIYAAHRDCESKVDTRKHKARDVENALHKVPLCKLIV